jgi:Tol biopolymer transport system component
MPSLPKAKPLVALLAAAVLLALPAAAQAALAYVKNPVNRTVFVAEDDGSNAQRLDSGSSPRVSPDGQAVAYLHEGPGNVQELRIAAASGGLARTLMTGFRDSFQLAFSPDSRTLAALRGPELGKRKLVLIDLATGGQRVVASGYFGGFSFSPDGAQLVYSRAGSERFPPRSDVFRYEIPIPGAIYVRPPGARRLTSDHRSLDPVWGPTGQIVFVKMVGAKKRRYGPKNELFLMSPDGKGVKRLTHTKVDPLLLGLSPTEWSATGRRLLAEFQGQDTSYAVAVNPRTGAQRPVQETGEDGFVGSALSADGTTVLGFTGGFEPEPNHDVATVPYGGGKLKILVKNAFEPDWSR